VDLSDDELELSRISTEFADLLVDSLPGWLERVANQRMVAATGTEPAEADIRAVAERCGAIADSISPAVREVVTADVDSAVGNPLALLREAVAPLNELLLELKVPAPARDKMDSEMFPADTYGLGPASFADVDPALVDAGITWGAARAHVHLRRHASAPSSSSPPRSSQLGSDAVPDHSSFDQILSSVANVEGWMTDDQARLLHDRAGALVPAERIVEIGSFRGRSLIVMAKSAVAGVEIVAIDPHGGGDRGPQEIAPDQALGDDDHSVFNANLAAAGVADRVNHVRKMSDDALGDVPGSIDLLYIDGAHRFAPARADIVAWGNRVRPDGTMLIHDSFSSIGVTLALLSTTCFGGRWRFVGRAQSMAEFRRAELSGMARVGNAAKQIAQMPWFVRNVIIKLLITVKLAPLARLLGHHGTDWPY